MSTDRPEPPSSEWLFPEGEGPNAATAFPKRQIAEMHRRFRSGPALTSCGACRYFGRWGRRNPAKAYSKCSLFGTTHGPGSDWNRKWPACGAFEPVPERLPDENDFEYQQRRYKWVKK